ncbi:MAG TPA: glycosyltransferase family 39 protein [Terriglobia bacterium]|nr:glycosyltransferase family 39 protein [Terriglobia bacterium]
MTEVDLKASGNSPKGDIPRPASTPPLWRFWQRASRPVTWILLAGGALRILFFFIGENAGVDALARAQLTASWLQHPDFRLDFGVWLPIHFWLMAGLALLVGHVELAGRLLSLLLGVASLGAFWALAKEVYGAPAAKFSLLVFALYSLHIGYSTTSSSEAPYLFFVLAGMLCFFAYRRSGSHLVLALGAATLGMGAGIRYEAWLFIFAAFLILLFLPSRPGSVGFWKAAHLREVLLFGVIAGFLPVLLMVYQWKFFGMPLYGATVNHSLVADQLAAVPRSMIYRLALFPGVIFLTLNPVVLAAALYGLVRGFRRRAGRDFAWIFLLVAAVTGYQILGGGLLPLARYTLTLGCLLALAAGHGVEEVARFLSQRSAVRLRLAVGLLVALNLCGIYALSRVPNRFNGKFRAISPKLQFQPRVEGLGHYLKPKLGPNASVVIEDYEWDAGRIAHVIGLPLLPGSRLYVPSKNDVPGLLAYMKSKHPQYLICANRGVLRPLLRLTEGCAPADAAGMSFRCLFENDTYRVYAVGY